MHRMGLLAIFLALTTVERGIADDLLWDNDIEPNLVDGRATSPPDYPDFRVTDDFTIPDGDDRIWKLQSLRVTSLEWNGWQPGTTMQVYLYANDAGSDCPGELVQMLEGAYERVFLFPVWNGDVYEYRFLFDDRTLAPGTYHVGYRVPEGECEASTYWLTSDGGQGTKRTGCLSVDAGETWTRDGDERWHHAFELYGVVTMACRGDIDRSGAVDFDDLLAVLGAWGLCPAEGDCLADLDDSGDVGLDDLLIVLAAWGPCP